MAHHIDCTIPHYRALEATNAIKEAFPKAYLYDPTPVHKVGLTLILTLTLTLPLTLHLNPNPHPTPNPTPT